MSSERRSLNSFVQNSAKLVKDKYRLGDAIGKGAFGKVFRSVNIQTGEVVAIKQIEKNLLQDNEGATVQREIEMLQKLSHPNIVKYIEQYETKSHIYLMLELLEGGSLYDLVKRCGTFPESLLRVYLVQILEALRYLHSQFIVHRDLKGANIMLTKDGVCKLGDFGSCAEVKANRRLSMLSTPFWTAPEIIEGTDGGVLSDIWGLGCTTLELLTSYPPYWNQGTGVALFKMVEDPHPPFPPNLSPELEEFLLSCFVKDIEKRSSAEALLQHAWVQLSNTNSSNAEPEKPTTVNAPPSPTQKRANTPSTQRTSLFHSLFSKKEKDESPPSTERTSPTLDRNQSTSGSGLNKKVTPTVKISESGEGDANSDSGIQESQPDFQEVVNSWKDKESKRPMSVQLARSSSQPFSGRERGSTFTAPQGQPKPSDPRAQRRTAIEGSISDWFGDSWKAEVEKEKKKEKNPKKGSQTKKKLTFEPLQKEPSNLVKEMGKKLEQEIAKRQKLTQLLEGHKNTSALLMEQKNEVDEKLFLFQRLAREKELKKLLSAILEIEEEISDAELLTFLPPTITATSSTISTSPSSELSSSSSPSSSATTPTGTSSGSTTPSLSSSGGSQILSSSSGGGSVPSPSLSNWRTPGTRCMVKISSSDHSWQEGVILKQSQSATDCPGFHDYRVMLLGTLPSIEEIMVGPNSIKQLGT